VREKASHERFTRANWFLDDDYRTESRVRAQRDAYIAIKRTDFHSIRRILAYRSTVRVDDETVTWCSF
jgi:hypothetical protein